LVSKHTGKIILLIVEIEIRTIK